MSHNPDTIITCPNCGYDAKYNYCAKCGQATHLHKDTFAGLVLHFIEHYFHYDSKFWQTLKLLWFKPGKLTEAYRDKQRTRYIAPISLYIFLSAVFFITNSLLDNLAPETERPTTNVSATQRDSVQRPKRLQFNAKLDSASSNQFIAHKLDAFSKKHPDTAEYFNEALAHNMPKVFFFSIPIMALLLKLFYARRRALFYTDHAVFALHFHSFAFSALTIANFFTPASFGDIVMVVMLLVVFVYLILAMHNFYRTKWWKSILAGITLEMIYLLVLSVCVLCLMLIAFLNG